MNENDQSLSDLEDFLTGHLQPSAAKAKPLPGAEPTDKSQPKAPETAPKVDAQRGADFLRDQAFAAFMASAVDRDLAARLPVNSFELYHANLLQELGNPTDPIVRMMAEQVVVAHFTYLRLQVRVANAKTPAECGVLGSTACQVMAEFRRSAVSLSEMRKSVPAATAALSSNIAPAHAADLPGTDKSGDSVEQELAGKTASRSKLGSNGVQEPVDDRATATVPFKKPASRRRRKVKSA